MLPNSGATTDVSQTFALDIKHLSYPKILPKITISWCKKTVSFNWAAQCGNGAAQTSLPLDHACNSNITTEHFYSVVA